MEVNQDHWYLFGATLVNSQWHTKETLSGHKRHQKQLSKRKSKAAAPARWKSTKITDIYSGLPWSILNDTQKEHSLVTKGIKSGFPSKRAKLHHLTERVPLSKATTLLPLQLEMTEFLVLPDLLKNRFINFMLYIKYKHHNSVILVFFSTCVLVLTFQWVGNAIERCGSYNLLLRFCSGSPQAQNSLQQLQLP